MEEKHFIAAFYWSKTSPSFVEEVSHLPLDILSSPSTAGAFETMLVYGTRVNNLSLHTARLSQALRWLGVEDPSREATFAFEVLNRWLSSLPLSPSPCKVRLTVTLTRDSFFAVCERAQYKPPETPARILISEKFMRWSMDASCRFKLTSRVFLERCFRHAKDQGFDDALIVNERGEVCETTRANIFFITRKEEIITPPLESGLLPGTVRTKLLENLQNTGVKIREQPISISLIEEFESAFITNALLGVRPVCEFAHGVKMQIDHPILKKIQQLYKHFSG